ncbi:hypothetical protein [uncultured Pelagimonas sp.]|uniref:hypothetical protein n=1 Tax=uncultured Pelagimonas sp. TaxID=1618102 RepID=UPI002612442D|nr:hypothetical protein [uncultured Pelagimonas sp.]
MSNTSHPVDHVPAYAREKKARPFKTEIDLIARLAGKAIDAASINSGKRSSAIGRVAASLTRAYLTRMADGFDEAFISTGRLARSLRIGRATVCRQISALCQIGVHIYSDSALGGRVSSVNGWVGKACGRAVDLDAVRDLIERYLPHSDLMKFIKAFEVVKGAFLADDKCLTSELGETPTVSTTKTKQKPSPRVRIWMPTRPVKTTSVSQVSTIRQKISQTPKVFSRWVANPHVKSGNEVAA